jgi:hypothetical protein
MNGAHPITLDSEYFTFRPAVAHPKGGSGALYRGQGENKKKGGLTVKKYYISKNIFNNKERTNDK